MSTSPLGPNETRSAVVRLRAGAAWAVSASGLGVYIVAALRICERIGLASTWSAIHGDWALIFIFAMFASLLSPVALLVALGYSVLDRSNRVAWAIGVILLLPGMVPRAQERMAVGRLVSEDSLIDGTRSCTDE